MENNFPQDTYVDGRWYSKGRPDEKSEKEKNKKKKRRSNNSPSNLVLQFKVRNGSKVTIQAAQLYAKFHHIKDIYGHEALREVHPELFELLSKVRNRDELLKLRNDRTLVTRALMETAVKRLGLRLEKSESEIGFFGKVKQPIVYYFDRSYNQDQALIAIVDRYTGVVITSYAIGQEELDDILETDRLWVQQGSEPYNVYI